MLAAQTFDIAQLIGKDKGLAILPQALPPVLSERMDRHRKETQFHCPHPCVAKATAIFLAFYRHKVTRP
jgi:hypothetical protein